MLTTKPRTIVNATKCVVEGNTATIETIDGTQTVEVDRCIFDSVSVYHRECGVFYEFEFPMNLILKGLENGVVLADETLVD